MKAELFALQVTVPAGDPQNPSGEPVIAWAGPRPHEFVFDRSKARLADAGFWLKAAKWPDFQEKGLRAELVPAERIGR